MDRALARLEDERACRVILGAAMLAYAALVLWIGRGTTLFVDEADVFRVDRGFDAYALFTPLNGHLEILLRFMYAVDFKLFGADFTSMRVVEAVGGLLAAGAFFALARRRVAPALALALTVLLLFLGSAWEVTFIESGITHVYCIAAGLGALLGLERRTPGGDVVACLLLIVSIASYTFGVAFAVGAAILILLGGGPSRRLWVALVPLALYAVWFIWVRAVYVPEHGEVQNLALANVPLIPNFVADAAAAAAGAVAGLNHDFTPDNRFEVFTTESLFGPLIAVLAAVALAVRIVRRGARPFLWATLAVLLLLWVGLGLGSGLGRTPETVRYVYAAGALALLVGAEAMRGVRLSRTTLLAALAAVVLALVGNLGRLRDGANYYRTFATDLRGQLTAIEIARDRVDPGFVPAGPATFAAIAAGSYLDAVDRIGSPAFSPVELAGQSEGTRSQADSALVPALGLALEPMRAREPMRDCRQLTAPAAGAIAIPAGLPGLALRSQDAADVSVRRFADEATVALGSLYPGRRTALRVPADRSAEPWTVVVSPAQAATVTACRLPAPAA